MIWVTYVLITLPPCCQWVMHWMKSRPRRTSPSGKRIIFNSLENFSIFQTRSEATKFLHSIALSLLSVSVIGPKAIVSLFATKAAEKNEAQFDHRPLDDFQLGFAQSIKVIARVFLHLISRIIQLWMSVHERPFDVFQSGTMSAVETFVDLENHEKNEAEWKGLEKGKITRSPGYKSTKFSLLLKCKRSTQLQLATKQQQPSEKAQKPFNWNLIFALRRFSL